MKWLTLEYVKAHSRIEYDCEDSLLELYAESAEESVLNWIGRTYDDVLSEFGEVPKPLYHAALMLVDLSYQQRSAISMQNLYAVPYTFDFLVKPYMKLTVDDEPNPSGYAVLKDRNGKTIETADGMIVMVKK